MVELAENCDECPHFGKSINNRPMCFKIKKEFDEGDILDIDEGFIPSWCPLLKDG